MEFCTKLIALSMHGQSSQFHPEVVWWEVGFAAATAVHIFIHSSKMKWNLIDVTNLQDENKMLQEVTHCIIQAKCNNTSIHAHVFEECRSSQNHHSTLTQGHVQNSVSEHPEDHASSIKTFRCNFIESSFWIVWNISPVACMGIVGWSVYVSSLTCSK